MAISRSSALKINTKAWITFSITIPVKQKHTRSDCAPLLPLRSFSLRAPLYVWVAGGEPDIKAEQQKNGNSSGAQKQGGLCLIIHQSNVTAQRANNTVDQLYCCCCCCCWRDTRQIEIPANKRNCNIPHLQIICRLLPSRIRF